MPSDRGAITGGAGLSHSSRAKTIKRGPDATVLVTDGPFAEAVEQISDFFIVSCDDYEALVEAAQILTGPIRSWRSDPSGILITGRAASSG